MKKLIVVQCGGKKIWKDIKIAFMTPQVLQNDIISNHYSLENVSLIIFDECHRAIGDYSYCFIAEKYKNDPRLAFIQTGFGLWSEYHIYDGPFELGKTFPSKDFQDSF